MDAVAVLQTVLTALQSGSVSLNGTGSLGANATTPSVPATISPLSILQLPTLLSHLLSLSAVRDWLKLLLIGGVLEILRRSMASSWTTIKSYFWITVTLEETDDCGYWLLYWLSKHKVFRTARTLEVSTRSFPVDTAVASDSSDLDDSSRGRNISFLPSLETTYALWYKYHYVTVTRNQVNDGAWQTRTTLCIKMFARNHRVLRDLLLEAKKQYLTASDNTISIYVSTSDYWKLMSSQQKRSMKSIILDPGVIDLVLNDAKDFLASKEWYAERGIPHRRGYLLYGAPGSGKTSLIHSIAGELNLDVYILSLTRLGMDDSTLSAVISELPTKCIVLVEDIDAAFHHGIKRDIVDPEKQKAEDRDKPSSTPTEKENSETASRITLSGLLNALDGIGAQEGRILFATTNDYRALDPALCRPGRLDLHIEFKLASKYQCRELFRRFYLPSSGDHSKESENKNKKEQDDEKDSGYGSHADSIDSASPTPQSSSSAPSSSPSISAHSDSSTNYIGIAHSALAPKLSPKQAAELADRFAALIPNRAFSMATLQGYLMLYKTRPHDALEAVPAWIEKKLKEKEEGARSDAPISGADEQTPSSSSTSSPSDSDVKIEDASTSAAPPAETKVDGDGSDAAKGSAC